MQGSTTSSTERTYQNNKEMEDNLIKVLKGTASQCKGYTFKYISQ